MNADNKARGYVQIYTGMGKGKTTAAIGLAVRASGHGLKTYIGQFMKGQPYGELSALKDHPFITIEQYGDTTCIHKEEVTPRHKQQAIAGLNAALQSMLSEKYDIIVLDEVNVAIWFQLIVVKDVLAFLNKRPENVEVVLTGRYAPQELIDCADLVSDINEVKHYYRQGIVARNGIER